MYCPIGLRRIAQPLAFESGILGYQLGNFYCIYVIRFYIYNHIGYRLAIDLPSAFEPESRQLTSLALTDGIGKLFPTGSRRIEMQNLKSRIRCLSPRIPLRSGLGSICTLTTVLVISPADLAAQHASVQLQAITPTAIAQTQGDSLTSLGYAIDNLINGSGLSDTPTEANLDTVTHSSGRMSAWVTQTQGDPSYFEDPSDHLDPQFTLTLDGPYSLSELVIWGYGGNTNEASDFTVEFSTDGGNSYSTATETVQTSGLVGNDHARLAFDVAHETNFVRLTITNNAKVRGFLGAGGDRVGLGEIRFIGRTVSGEGPTTRGDSLLTQLDQDMLTLNVDAIATGDTVNIAEKAAGFTISGDTGSVGGVTVTVTVGTMDLTATSSNDNPAIWSVNVPGNAAYITGTSVAVTVSAAKTGYAAPSPHALVLAVDLVALELPSAVVSGNTLTLTYDKALDTNSVPPGSAFTVKVNGTAVALAGSNPVAVSGTAVTLTLAAAVPGGATVTVSYEAPSTNPIRDSAGNSAVNVTDRMVQRPSTGSFGDQTVYTWTDGPTGRVFAGDFNGDDHADVGVWETDGDWLIRYGDGSGSFSSQTTYRWSSAQADAQPVVADFDDDGDADIGIFYEDDGRGSTWTLRYGDRNGSFANETAYTAWTGVDLYAQPFAADFDGDGNADIGVWTPGLDEEFLNTQPDWEAWGGGGPGNWHIRYGDGNGGFSRQTLYKWVVALKAKPLAGDFNGDDLGDIGVWNSDGTWKVRYGDGSGQFDNETVYSWAGMPTGEPFAADFDGDGNTDIGVWTPDDEDGDINDGDDAWTINYLLRAADSRAVVTSPSPQAQGSIDAVGLTVGRAAWREDLSGYFSHAQSYTVASSDTAVARVRVTGSLVTIEPVAAGAATITVTAANDDTTTTAMQTIAVTVRADSVPPEPVVDARLPAQNVVWTSRTTDNARQGMPIGNGKYSALVWAGSNRDLYLLLGAGNFWSGNVHLKHPGKIRIRYSGTPFDSGFRQELKLKEGEIVVTAGSNPQIETRIWADANAPVIHIESKRTAGTLDYGMTVTFQSLRTTEKAGVDTERNLADFTDSPFSVVVKPDTTETDSNAVYWYQRNTNSYFDELIEHQGLDASRYSDILTGRTYGGRLEGDGFTVSGTGVSKSNDASFRAAVTLHSEVVDSVATWKTRLNALRVPLTTNIDTQREAHRAWWANFWNRSYIFAEGHADATNLTQKYAVARYLQACAGRTPGMPIRFTGSIFTVGNARDPDYRKWNSYHHANQRFSYWGMHSSGDFDLMQPHFDMYATSLKLARDRVSAYWGPDTEGAMWHEVVGVFGHTVGAIFGWRRRTVGGYYDPRVPPGPAMNPYHRHLYAGNIEMVAMMLDHYEYTLDEAFAKRRLLPVAREVLKFYFTNWDLDENGKLFIANVHSGEEDRVVDNPTADVSSLHRVLTGLLALPDTLATADEKADWTTQKGQLPPISIENGRFKSAADLPNSLVIDQNRKGPPWVPINNTSIESANQNLYPVFPLRRYGYGQPDLEIATATYNARFGPNKTQAWNYSAVPAAYLGLIDDAKARTLDWLGGGPQGGWRFIGFPPGQPDGDPGVERPAIGKIAFQAMLMHPGAGDEINLLNAWPNNWNVQFKLHAPKATVVKGSRAGTRIAYTVSPASRASNVTVRGSLTVNEQLALRVDAVAGDNVVDAAEKAAGFTIGGQTGSVSGATVVVTLGGTALGSVTSGSDGSWSVNVPMNADYITGTNVVLTVTASKPGYLDAAVFERTLSVTVSTTLVLNVDAIATDDTVNIEEKAAGFAISGDTGSEGGVTVTVTVGTTPLTATSAVANPATWLVNVPANASYISEPSVAVEVNASKTEFAAASAVQSTLAVDLTAPTAPTYTAPGSLQVGGAISAVSPSGGSGIAEYGATGLPPGLNIDPFSGVISGTPDRVNASTASATVTVTDTADNAATVLVAFPVVAKGDQTLTGFQYSSNTVTLGSAAPTVTAPSGAQGALSYSATATAVCTVDPGRGELTIMGVGECEVTVMAADTDDYNEATATYTVTVQAVVRTVGSASISAGNLLIQIDSMGVVTGLYEGDAEGTDHNVATQSTTLVSLVVENAAGDLPSSGTGAHYKPTGWTYAAGTAGTGETTRGTYTFNFADNISVVVTVVEKAGYATLELTSVTNPHSKDIRMVIWGPLTTDITENIGETVGLVSNRDFAIGLFGTNAKTTAGWPRDYAQLGFLSNLVGGGARWFRTRVCRDLFWWCNAAPTTFGSILQTFTRDLTVERVFAPETARPWGTGGANDDGEPLPVTPLTGTLATHGQLVGSKVALFGVARSAAAAGNRSLRDVRDAEMLDRIGVIEVGEGMPHPIISKVWGKKAEKATAPYFIFGDLVTGNLDNALSVANDVGWKSIYRDTGWGVFNNGSLGFGSHFGGSEAGLRAAIAKVKAKHVSLGTHSLFSFVPGSLGARYPGDLAVTYYGVLDGAHAADATTLTVRPYPGTSVDQLKENFGKGENLVIGNELMRFRAKTDGTNDITLSNLDRGFRGTTAVAHASGARVGKLTRPAYSGEYVAGLKLMYDVLVPALVEKMDLGLGSLSYDGSEWLSRSHGAVGHNLVMEKVFNDLADNEDFVHDGANSVSYTWHINSRYNWGETEDDILVAHQRLRWANQVYFRRNLIPPSMGWWRISDANEWRWALAKAASFDAGFAYFGSVAHQSRYNAALRLEIRDWLNATRAGVFDWPNRFLMQERSDYFELDKVEYDRAMGPTWQLSDWAKSGDWGGTRSNSRYLAPQLRGFPLTNLARDAQVTVSGAVDFSYSGGLAVDNSTGVGHLGEVWFSHDGEGEWAIVSGATEKWIELSWDSAQKVRRIILFDRELADQNTSAGTLTFTHADDSTTTQTVTGIAADGSPKIVDFAQKTVKKVRFTITAFSGTEPGLAEFVVLGPSVHYQSATLATGATVTGVTARRGRASRVNDGVIATGSANRATLTGTSAVLDLDGQYYINGLTVWHAFGDTRTYTDVIFEVADNDQFTNSTIVFNNDADDSLGQGAGTDAAYRESSAGKPVQFAPVAGRYVRLWSNGNSVDAANHLTEVEVYGTGNATTDVAGGGVTSGNAAASGLDNAIDHDPSTRADVGSGAQYLQIDLGSEKSVNSLLVMRDNADMRTYKGVVYRLSTSSNFASGVTTVFHNDNDDLHGLGLGESTDTEYQETENGRYVRFAPVSARYVRLYSAGSDYATGNRYREVLVGTQQAGTATPPQRNVEIESPAAQVITPIAIAQTQGDSRTDWSFAIGNLIDGNGLSATPTTGNLGTVLNNVYPNIGGGPTTIRWETATKGNPDYFGDSAGYADPQFTLTLDRRYSLSDLVIWGAQDNANEATDFTVEFSTDGGTTYSAATETVQTSAVIASGHARLSFDMAHEADTVRLTITKNAKGRGFAGAGGDRVALGEIRFVGSAVASNAPPVAMAGSLVTLLNTAGTLVLSTLASDAEGGTLSYAVTQPSNGSVSRTGAVVTYTPNIDHHGTDSFNYTVTDDANATATATVIVTVHRAPTAQDASVTTPANTALTYDLSPLAFDPDGDTLEWSVGVATNGTVGLLYVTGGSVIYTPDDGYVGMDSFTYTVADSHGAPATGTITVAVGAALLLNVDAIATGDTVNIAEKAAGFTISGDTGSVGGVTVTVYVGTMDLTATSSNDNPAIWSVNVPGNAAYITGTSVAVTVSAAKTGYAAPSPHALVLAVDLVAPTAPAYTAPGSLKVGVAIAAMSPSGGSGSGIDEYGATGLPSGLSIDPFSGVISGTPDRANASTASAMVTVTDTADNAATVLVAFPVVAKGDQTLTGFQYSSNTVTLGSAAPTVTAPSGAQGALSYSATATAVCTVDPGRGELTIVGVGECEVTVTAADTADYNEAMATYTVTVQEGTLSLNLNAIATDDTVNIEEKAAGFAISGDTGSEGGVTVTVTVGTTPLTATSAVANPATWSVSVPANASYISESSVAVEVNAAKTGFAAPAGGGPDGADGADLHRAGFAAGGRGDQCGEPLGRQRHRRVRRHGAAAGVEHRPVQRCDQRHPGPCECEHRQCDGDGDGHGGQRRHGVGRVPGRGQGRPDAERVPIQLEYGDARLLGPDRHRALRRANDRELLGHAPGGVHGRPRPRRVDAGGGGRVRGHGHGGGHGRLQRGHGDLHRDGPDRTGRRAIDRPHGHRTAPGRQSGRRIRPISRQSDRRQRVVRHANRGEPGHGDSQFRPQDRVGDPNQWRPELFRGFPQPSPPAVHPDAGRALQPERAGGLGLRRQRQRGLGLHGGVFHGRGERLQRGDGERADERSRRQRSCAAVLWSDA